MRWSLLLLSSCKLVSDCPTGWEPGEAGCLAVVDPTAGLVGGRYGAGELGAATDSPASAEPFSAAEFGITERLGVVDWRDVYGVSYVTPVRDQGATQTSAFFASTAAVESTALITTPASADDDLSEQLRYDCSDATSDGYSLVAALDEWTGGTVTEAELPWTGTKASCSTLTTAWPVVRVLEVEGRDLEAALHLGPVVTRMDVYDDLVNVGSEVYTVAGAPTGFALAVTVVGFNHDEAYWIIKNSWGTGWGDAGFARIAFDQPGFGERAWLPVLDTDNATAGLDLLDYFDPVDDDDDGFYTHVPDDCLEHCEEDCDDTDPLAFPGANERCDEVDNDCDDEIDEDVQGIWFLDGDGDTHGAGDVWLACRPPAGYVVAGDDCDDADNTVAPELPELCDGKDNDCDTRTDEDFDSDGDGYLSNSCAGGDDCDDTDAAIFGGGNEECGNTVDEDCNGAADACLCDASVDADHDNCYDASRYSESDPEVALCNCPDGNDADYTIHPGATEICDHKDNDEDASTDEDVTDPFWADTDGDGFGDPLTEVQDCPTPDGYVDNDLDCDDADAADNPNVVETCDVGLDDDDDCDNNADPIDQCDFDRDGVESVDGDCDDGEATIYPNAPEVCDDVDTDCDGVIDDGVTTTYFEDVDDDGFGASDATTEACSVPSGYSTTDTDCDDNVDTIHPGADEDCGNGEDDDCDGDADEECGLLILTSNISLRPGVDGSVTIELPDEYDDVSYFLAPYTAVEHSDDQCDYVTTMTLDTSTDPDTVEYAVRLEHCGTSYGDGTNGFEATAVAVVDLNSDSDDAWVSTCVSEVGDAGCSADLPPSGSAGSVRDFCALHSFDANGDVDAQYTCEYALDSSSDTITGELNQNYGNGSTWGEGTIVALATPPALESDWKPFSCSSGSSDTVTHLITVPGSHKALVLPDTFRTGTDDHFSWWTTCQETSSGSNDYYECTISCAGSGRSISGNVLFLDGDFE